MPLSDSNIVQSNSGGFNSTSGDVTLGAATTAGNTLVIAVTTLAQSIASPPAGYVQDSPATALNPRLYVYRKSNCGASETLPTISVGATTAVAWICWELSGLDPTLPVDVIAASQTATSSGTTINNGTTAASTTYDGLVLAFHTLNVAGTTPGSISGQSGGLTELAEQGQAGTANSVTLAAAGSYTQQLGAFTSTATASATMTGSNGGVAWILVYSAEGAKRAADLRDLWGFEWLTTAGWGTGNTGNRIFATVTGSPELVNDAAKARTGSGYLRLSSTAAAENVQGEQQTISGTDPRVSPVMRVCFRFDGGLPSANVDLACLRTIGDTILAYRTATQKLGLTVASGTEQLSDTTVTADTWICVDLAVWDAGSEWRAPWQIDYGDGAPVAQTQATFSTASSTGAGFIPILGWLTSTTPGVPVLYDDCVVSTTLGHYPLGDHRIHGLAVDGSVTISGTSGNFQTFTANGTMAAWNGTTAQGAIDDIPPTIGASADGIAQITAASGDYMAIPLETRAAVPDETIRGVKLLVCGWAASATAATIGLRAHDGGTEHTLFTVADPNFDNSTTTPAWLCKMVRTTAGARIDWTQAKLDALEARLGFSGDATPDIGAHLVMAEVAVQPVATMTLFGDLASQQLDPVSGGVQGVTVDTTVTGATADLTYEEGGTPTTVNVAADDTVTETIEAPDAPTVNRIELQPAPEA